MKHVGRFDKRNLACLFGCLLTGWLLTGCNRYEVTVVTITMTNLSSETVNLWIEDFEKVETANRVAPSKSRTFSKAFTFTDDHPSTHLNVVGTKNGVNTSLYVKVSADTAHIEAAYTTEARIALN